MANYICAVRTNYFRVTDEEKYQELFNGLCGEDKIYDFTEIDENGIKHHGFGCYGYIFYEPEDEEEEEAEGLDAFFEELQKILPEDEAFIYMEAGWEKLRYVVGESVIVTSKCIRTISIERDSVIAAREMLDNPDFTTKTIY